MLKKGFNLPFKPSQLALLHHAVSSTVIQMKKQNSQGAIGCSTFRNKRCKCPDSTRIDRELT